MPNHENPGERLDRELIELLNELRVLIPGIQVLFAFLLTVPFNSRFADITPGQKGAYYLAVVCTAVSTAFMLATPTYHRFLFRAYEKDVLLRLSNVFTLVGTGFLAVAIAAVMFLITDFLFDGPWSVVVTVGIAVLLGGLWFALPLTRRARVSRTSERPPVGQDATG